ncbi:MAG: CHRD domain-containing protein [Fibrobacteria bacterium]
MKKSILLAALGLTATVFGQNEGFRMFFTADLEGKQLVPAVTTSAKGLLGITMNGHGDSIAIYGVVTGLSGPITGLKLYTGARGAAGTLFKDIGKSVNGNSIAGNQAVSVPEIGNLMKGAYHVVVSTSGHPDGELRGQIELSRNPQFVAKLNGDGEAVKVATPGSGIAVFHVSPDYSVLTVNVTFGGLKDSVTSAYLGLGKAGEAGAIAFDLAPYLSAGVISGRIPFPTHDELAKTSGTSRVAHNELLASMDSGDVFLNIKTKAHADGEIRGQLEVSHERVFISQMNGAKNVPPVTTTDKGLGIFLLSENDSTLWVDASFQGLDSIAAVHVHSGSKATNADTLPGEPQVNLTSALTGNHVSKEVKVSSLGNPSAFLKDLYLGNIYVNAHSRSLPLGEIRGQSLVPLRIGTALPLEGAQETPSVTTKALGLAIVTMDPDSTNVVHKVLADSLSSQFLSAKIHKQVLGTAGDEVLDITPDFHFNSDSMSGVNGSGLWGSTRTIRPFTRALAAALAAESLYVNIATNNNVNGELRGQIKDRVPADRVVVTIWAAQAKGPSSRPLFVTDGNSVRLRAEAGRMLKLEILDLRGRSEYSVPLTIGADGYSRKVDLAGLKPGVHIAAVSGEKSGRITSRFLRR